MERCYASVIIASVVCTTTYGEFGKCHATYGLPEIGLPPVIIHFEMGFSITKTIQLWEYPIYGNPHLANNSTGLLSNLGLATPDFSTSQPWLAVALRWKAAKSTVSKLGSNCYNIFNTHNDHHTVYPLFILAKYVYPFFILAHHTMDKHI